MESVREFSNPITDQQSSAGGKGGTIARLYQKGFPVPGGFLILPSAFDGDELMPDAWRQVQSLLERYRRNSPGMFFAVRSSALAEDSSLASFAGEFETILAVRSDDEVREAIKTVRRSRRSRRVQSYSQAKSIDSDHEIGIIVQQLIPADISGILFTADPLTGSPERMVGNFVFGLGDKLVSGRATGEEFTVERSNGKYKGPVALRSFARKLFNLALRLEKELGQGQDIEWAIWKKELFILQSRPITTSISLAPVKEEWNDSLTGDYLWSNVNFGEAVTRVMTPLSWTVLKMIFGEYAILPGYDTVGNIGGRPYLNISLYASLFHALGRSHQDLLDTLEGTLYMQLPPGMNIPLVPLSRMYLLSELPALLGNRIKEWRGVNRLLAFLDHNPSWFRKMHKRLQGIETKAKLNALWWQEIRPHAIASLWCVMGSVFSSSASTMKLRRDLTDLAGPDDANVLISNLSDESSLLASLGPLVGIAKVASGEMERAAYLEQFGHRGPDEFELSVPRPSENPNWLDEQLAQYSQSPVDVEAMLAAQRLAFNAAWERFRIKYPRKSSSMRKRIAESARRARMRELARSEYVRDRWLIRRFALRAGELIGLGENIFFLTLDEVLDVLDGNDTAVSAIPDRKETYQRYCALPPYPSIIRGHFDPFQWASDPNRRSDIYDPSASAPITKRQLGDGEMIIGSPGSVGRVVGMVRRLDLPEDGHQLQDGEVLVTSQTDIAWTMLFPRAAAVVTDVGAPLSHAAIVARELGIPAVVGCGDATMRLSTGDLVQVDGARGIVEMLESKGG
jgi:phosphohistidine swiveling domain-containing protein